MMHLLTNDPLHALLHPPTPTTELIAALLDWLNKHSKMSQTLDSVTEKWYTY